MTTMIYIQQTEHLTKNHYRQIMDMYDKYLLAEGHEPLNEAALLALTEAINDGQAINLGNGEVSREFEQKNQTHLTSVEFRCSFFASYDHPEQVQNLETPLINRKFIDPDIKIPLDKISGYIQLSNGHGRWHAAMIIAEPNTSQALATTKVLLQTSSQYISDNGGGIMQLFAPTPPENIIQAVRELSFEESSVLFSMQKTIGAGDHLVADRFQRDKISTHPLSARHQISIRPFQIGRDEQAWLHLNHRAFKNHLDQGRWTLGDLIYRENLSWFDPEGFLLLEIDSKAAGFCWTKVAENRFGQDRKIGEIYILAVDSDWQGHGLGTILLSSGIAYLESTGADVCSLYCESSNTSAVKLYESLGFELHHRDILYSLNLPGNNL